MVKKVKQIEVFKGFIYNLGSEKKNIASVRRRLKNQRYKGKFKIQVAKTPKTPMASVKFVATRKKK